MIVLEGVDGAGKTTLAPLVAQLIGYRFVPKKTIPDGPPFVERTLRALASALWDSGDGADFPSEFWLHLQLGWYIALSNLVVTVRQNEASVIVDGWYYKFIAKLIVRGFDMQTLTDLFRAARVPEMVVLLDVDVESLWLRRGRFRDGEMGLHAGYPRLDRASLADYQGRIQRVLREFADRYSWSIVRVPTGETPETTALRVAAACRAAKRTGAISPHIV